LNNVASGVGAGLAGISPLATTLLAGAFSLLCVGGGSRLGWAIGRQLFGSRASVVAGLTLAGVGVAALTGVA
jgi:putative Mn2+ efflux pump MntP